MPYFILYKIGEFVALHSPIWFSYRLAGFVSLIKYLFSPRERQEIVANLALVLPNKDLKTLRRYSREIFVNFSEYLVDFFRFSKVDPDYIKKHVEIINLDYIDETLKKGKGLIIVSAHLGSWELGGAIMGALGYPLNAVAMDHKNRRVNKFFVKQRENKNIKVISMNFALRKCFSVLNNNEILALVGDKDFSNGGMNVKFFGKKALLPKGPAFLSLKLGAPIIPAFTIRTHEDNFQLIFEKPVEFTPSGDFDKDVVNLIECYGSRLESCIRKYPTQWYCFRRFW
jgi:Kdo2-lipid IVA lauroyltransferase/acyltransferase